MLKKIFLMVPVLLAACSDGKNDTCLHVEGPQNAYTMTIQCEGFRFSFRGKNGEIIAAPHPLSGVVLNDSDVVTATLNQQASSPQAFQFLVTNKLSQQAIVRVEPQQNNVRISVQPQLPGGHNIVLRTAGLTGPVYGLADDGRQVNVFGIRKKAIHNDGGHDRFVSTFAIAPAENFAQIVMVRQQERFLSGDNRNVPHSVTLDTSETAMGAANVTSVEHFNYFLGTPREIYRAFSKAKISAGYGDVKPSYGMFGLGWEAWPLLSWKTNARAVEESVSSFLDRGYPLSWAVVGSGFWEEGGTTTSFGRWNQAQDKYPNPEDFKSWFKEKNIALLLGLRTQFVDGLGVNSGTGRDGSIGLYLENNQTPIEYKKGLEKGFFATNGRETFRTASGIFPKWDKDVPVLDSNNPRAVEWYTRESGLWGVDGWKEDTMLTDAAHVYHDGHWNPVMRALHERGDLVMARNAYVSSPGSVQRLNDTAGEEDRIPQLVLAYGASGAPNVYADIIGNHDQKNSQYLQRHAKLQALTAAMSFGIEPWTLGEKAEANIKAAAQWHQKYRPYLYSAALKSYHSGYPYTATPLPIAYPHDSNTYDLHKKKMWQWLIDESVLAHPLFDSDNESWLGSVYLPEGNWIDPNTAKRYTGPITLEDYDYSGAGMPIFFGGKGIVVSENSDGQLYAELWPVGQVAGTEYQYLYSDNKGKVSTSTITLSNVDWRADTLVVENQTNGSRIEAARGKSGQFVFPLNPENDYRVTEGR